MTSSVLLRKLARVGTIALTVFCLVELGAFFAFRHAAAIYRTGQVFPAPSGYQTDRLYTPETPAPCYLVRITADSCPYCKRDKQQYGRLTEAARRTGCRTTEIGPRTGDVQTKSAGTDTHLEFVDMKMAQTYNPFLTPQTMLLDEKGRLSWQRQGAMDDEDLETALALVHSRFERP